jgi:hypothetical protein
LLKKQLENNDQIDIKKIDVFQQPFTALKEKVFFIPTITTDRGHKKTFLLVSEDRIAHFFASISSESE